jgi:hypothetical protein
MLVPEWQAQAWWPMIMKEANQTELIVTTHDVYNRDGQLGYITNMPKFNMWMVVVDRRSR